MFLKTSRYARTPTDTTTLPDGRQGEALRLRRLEAPPALSRPVVQGERLDIIADEAFSDATRFWHVADANTALDARELTARVLAPISIPES